MGESDRQSSATGAFGSGQANQDVMSRRTFGGAGRGAFGGGSGSGGGSSGFGGAGRAFGGVKREPGTGDYTIISQPIKSEYGGEISSDEDEGDQANTRINIDNLIDLTGDDDEVPEQQSQFIPVRLKREAHKDRNVGVNADGAIKKEGDSSTAAGQSGEGAPSEKRRGKQRAKDVEITGEGKSFQPTYSSSDEQEPVIKAEPTDDDGTIIMAPAAVPAQTDAMVPQELPSSPESKRKAKEKLKTRTLSGSAPERPAYQTQEEIDEWERHQADLRILHSELGSLVLPSSTDQDGDAAMEGSSEQPRDKKADKVYLFQFPPVLPDLVPIQVKADPDAPPPEDGADVMEVDQQPNTASNPVTVPDEPNKPRQPKLPSGYVGKLRVHKSGKATLDWGGTSLVVGMGTEATFLQDIMVATLPDQKEEAKGEASEQGTGVAMSMGQVKGKFVVTPDWERLLA
jgi:DNA-directed RNA polymerase III subunit RPC4